MFFIGFVSLEAAFVIILLLFGPDERIHPREVEYPAGYKEDIDWSLMVKGYPVVNEVDIQYSEWLAANPGKVV